MKQGQTKESVSVEQEAPDVAVQKDWIYFDFVNSAQFERTIPAYCSIKGQKIEGKNWARILVEITEQEVMRNNPSLGILYQQSLIANRKGHPFFLPQKLEGLNQCH